MSVVSRNIDIIHNCEDRFFNWLKIKLACQGISADDFRNLSELLECHEKELVHFHQHLKPLKKWNQTRLECDKLNASLNGNAENDEYLAGLLERTAFEGQVLWLTFQEE